MAIDLEVLGVQQYVSGKQSWAFNHRVGSTHFDAGIEQPDGSVAYNYENLWLRYHLNLPRKIKRFRFEATYGMAMNGPEYVRGQRFGWGFGTATAPGNQTAFYWDVDNKTSGLIEAELRMPSGEAWFWLTYDYAGQNNCYVQETALPVLQGEPVGSIRVADGAKLLEGIPHICRSGTFKRGEVYVCKDGVWRPGN